MIKREKIISLKEFKENRKLVAPDGTPYTGVYTDYYDWENDQKEREEYYKDGKENGLSTWWYENGHKEYENHCKDGKQNGLSTWWYANGQKEYENHYKDGKLNGLSTCWYENGQKECEVRYENGKENGLCTWWCENGQIECEGFFKDGIEVDDPRTELDENELLSPSNAPAVFIKEFCLVIFYGFLGVKLSSYIFDVWL
jgi:antitoxin component YwqK of YwqJK toxin-antitoxin module